jgi:hypothetical protein
MSASTNSGRNRFAVDRQWLRQMEQSMFSSDRHFFLVSYQASHGLLLFRSPKERGGMTTRLDVLFNDVRAIELRVWTESLFIEEVEAGSIADALSRPIALVEPGNRVYALGGDDWKGFVVGGIVMTAEDDKDMWEPSSLISQIDGAGVR